MFVWGIDIVFFICYYISFHLKPLFGLPFLLRNGDPSGCYFVNAFESVATDKAARKKSFY